MLLRHYGSSAYDPALLRPIRNRRIPFVKPLGGLWTSPVDSDWGWVDWCKAEEYGLSHLCRHFDVRFKGKLLTVDSEADLDLLPWRDVCPGINQQVPDFEAIVAEGYQGMHLTVDGQHATRTTWPRTLYGWDCESVLIFDPDSIELP